MGIGKKIETVTQEKRKKTKEKKNIGKNKIK